MTLKIETNKGGNRGMKNKIEKCYGCGEQSQEDSNLCQACEQHGVWIDPAGGVHNAGEEDPAAMYE
jgi:hypothetical protein